MNGMYPFVSTHLSNQLTSRMTDFPLSCALSQHTEHISTSNLQVTSHPHSLPPLSPHLAAQIPSTWLTPMNFPGMRLAICKVIWRALVGVLITKSNSKLHDRSVEEGQV